MAALAEEQAFGAIALTETGRFQSFRNGISPAITLATLDNIELSIVSCCGFPDALIATQPIHLPSRDDPPALLITGADGELVGPGPARLADRLRSHGVAVRKIIYPGLGHSRLMGALAAPLRGTAPVLDEVAAFVDARS